MKFHSPLRYPGGKSKIAPYIKKILSNNHLFDGIYVEPYAGGSGVALSLLFGEYVDKVIINDIDKTIYAFWHSILNETERFCEMILNHPITLEERINQKEIFTNNGSDLLKLGFSMFYLNRTNHSGISSAGLIGGNNQLGKWKLDARFNKEELIKRIRKISLYKNRIDLFNLDAIDLIKRIKHKLTQKDFLYFDPPYYIKGKELYLKFYSPEDHEIVCTEITKLEDLRWVVTYDNNETIRRLYQNFTIRDFLINYSAGKKTKGKEIMIFANNISIPDNEFIL